jgi:Mg2+ and Co2+ transporter CorA
MLRMEFPFRVERWPQRVLAVLLGEAFLGFLAILAAAVTLAPMLFGVSASTTADFDACQWAIIGWFALEYGFALACAPSKRAFLRNPWRLVDLATIVIPLATLLPSMNRALRSSPVLRLIRLIRVVTMGVRASGVVVRTEARRATEIAVVGPSEVTRLRGGAPAEASWNELLQWVKAPGPDWYHVTNPSPADLGRIAAAAGVPAAFLEGHLLGTTYPHVEVLRQQAALFVWLPEVNAAGQVDRHGLLFLIGADSLLSLSRRPTRLPASTDVAPAEAPDTHASFAVRMLGVLLREVVEQNERLVGLFEQELQSLEEVPVRDSRPGFFERTFRLKKELSATLADLWRLKSVLAELAGGRARLPGALAGGAEAFGRLAADANYLYETVANVREEALSLIELHINVVSFDMTRVMRLLAVVSVLGLVPAVVGGLFGMNLADNPWPFTLPQVAFSVCLGMVLGLYFFFVKGWLR